MKKRMFYIIFLMLFLAVLVVPAQKATAAYSCQCVEYIKNKYGLSGSVGGNGGAKNMGPYLTARGFTQVYSPVVGAVVVFQPKFSSTGVDQTYGHVGVISAVSDLGSYWQITVTGANQSGTKYTDANCSNVTNIRFAKYNKSWGTDYLSYYVLVSNLAKNKNVYATSSSPYYPLRNVNDGNASTRWSSAQSYLLGQQWLIIDLGTTTTISTVMINWEAAYAKSYFVGYSTNCSTFYGGNFSASSGGAKTYSFGKVTARCVGVLMKQRAPFMTNYSIYEIEVYNK